MKIHHKTLRYVFLSSAIILGLFLFSSSTLSKRNPPGTFFVKNAESYIDKVELTVEGWREFCWHMKSKKGDSVANLCLPDTSVIINHYGKNIFNSKDAIDINLPIVGVSLNQIQEYCKFRTWAVSQGKKFEKSRPTYELLDYTSAVNFDKTNIKNSTNELSKPSTKIPELIISDNEYKILVSKDSLVNIEDFKGAFGFRCVARM